MVDKLMGLGFSQNMPKRNLIWMNNILVNIQGKLFKLIQIIRNIYDNYIIRIYVGRLPSSITK